MERQAVFCVCPVGSHLTERSGTQSGAAWVLLDPDSVAFSQRSLGSAHTGAVQIPSANGECPKLDVFCDACRFGRLSITRDGNDTPPPLAGQVVEISRECCLGRIIN